MQRSTNRILTTHCGSLPRHVDLLDMMAAKVNGTLPDQQASDSRVRRAVADSVRTQADSGIDVPNDGEQGKLGFFTYVGERLTGFEPRPGAASKWFAAEVAAFPECYADYFIHAMMDGTVAPVVPMFCTGPVTYKGHDALNADLENLKAAMAGAPREDAFVPAAAPSLVGTNAFYPTQEEYLHAVAEALRTEYQAIVDAGFILQIDDPFLTDVFSAQELDAAGRRRKAGTYVDAINYSLRGIPEEKVRFHTCYGINEGPRIHDAPFADLVDVILTINAGAYLFEAANPRHEHEYHVWESTRLPRGKLIVPGVISHASNIVEHPELIAERLIRYATLVGREHVIAGADCGFSSNATYTPEIHPTVVWAKFKALAEGARLATDRLWK